MMLRVVRLNQHAQRFDEAVMQIRRIVTNLIDQFVELFDGSLGRCGWRGVVRMRLGSSGAE
jgi:hypothetical protein